MTRNYKRKTKRTFSSEKLTESVKDVQTNNFSIRKSAAKHGVSKSRLFDHIKKTKHQNIHLITVDVTTNFKKNQVFPPFMKALLAEYLIKCSAMFNGLTPKPAIRLAFEYTERNCIKYSREWKKWRSTGSDWFLSFLKLHPSLSIGSPEVTSLARMTSFNRVTVADFQNNFMILIHNTISYHPKCTIRMNWGNKVQRVSKVIARKRQHQVGQVTS